MIRILLFKLKTWYERAKVEYEESKVMQKMFYCSPWYKFPMLETSKTEIKITVDGKTYTEERTENENKEVSEERTKKME